MRKALTALETDRLIVRRQGRGTYVARHSRDQTLFHFFRMVGLDDYRLVPTSIVLTQGRQRATQEQAGQFPSSSMPCSMRSFARGISRVNSHI